ncbi:MAG: hypothetical protein KGI78_04395 [Patescibacteria group bacterium]|nr:hypothetical protein [Patescibacteria group bacterium]MDE1944157.1 hypothetical protein [Patescibacteria group bacterium]MDE1945440.1 hypothetical protein [Patescibacteria group bacterium]MDE2058052.1 hypothetical protein [Patescibacteria group bacterium]
MSWAEERKLVVFAVFAGVLLLVASGLYLAFFYQGPSCTDGVKDGTEQGPDCGGSCPYLCSATEEPPTVLFTQAIPNGAGRTDVIAEVENKNVDAAAEDVPYDLTVYGYDQQLIQHLTGTLELPPGASVPVFIPGIDSGKAVAGAAFLSIASSSVHWYALAADPRVVPAVSGIAITGASSTPRIGATLSNPSVRPLANVAAVVVVKDAAGNAIAASQTILPSIPALGSAEATFTWGAPFSAAPVAIEVLPVIPLPPQARLP